ncbi:MAG: hypothetical protein A3I44_03470 [Candidatus Sungbacteria bacterium RIFCSPLOWO2_02_FULL_51_17]|uniref:Uncharacterized protein n=1 Tax=Candidatus Sungbacteria bacterium RIFCSPHIGHO2_02_FULL_51_29 TaxID=1802273 RepID=A0A1G2KS52_9BACT|nr:MAG: hypothetical protein A2676_01350 [Candidatus Sungbacteria bacterium RIFCSPHIGHO2_01_FULL_51_22]OHA02094.1 MAG: hypothetical protein A3C16_04755 [Candidatus Sungbacteria bacterium RIFCSPHIGHO2_02_FULL_51_29]OHA06132.1 MAG: hypothetical protein A3B29_01685 [Candidatus Sungbacteria bacterium RIFCSPLOWO2_01_FULL_51_34]OHA10450.1 MAG: hypothetical protein A3I44_03470 [Candidatus Sungbacteria bacterium RIFCSPLOWO2_02_FULL_51_17]
METHTLTIEQLRKLVNAIGDGSNWPKHTDDPKVNYAVDCIVQDDGGVPTYDERLYVEEIEAFKALEAKTG